MTDKIYYKRLLIFFSLILFSCSGEKPGTTESNQDTIKPDTELTGVSEKSNPGNNPGQPGFNLKYRRDYPPLESKTAFIQWRLERIDEKEKLLTWRWDRAEQVILRKDITHKRVLEAFLRTPREVFARRYNESRAYEDAALGLSYGQTISGPHMVSRTTNELNPDFEHKVLEIGTGSGYQSAMFAQLSNHVYTIEIIEPLAEETAALQESMTRDFPEYLNIKHRIADGYYGWPEYAPFDRIAVTCGIDHIPPPLLEQLAPDGIMLIPVGPPNGQTMLKVTKTVNEDGSVTINREDVYKGSYYPVFVPFVNKDGIRHSVKQDMPDK
ncbi:MAG: protein-L-isoaspartate O-methyltransferase [Spirochaetales bacterium]|nr:protein-L-isoaspartate O-methyltransferase [Spirochaetales bacterium]